MHVPARTCIGCRATCPASQLVRLVLTERAVAVAARSSGRGAWLHPSADCARAAIKTRAFARAFRKTVSFPTTEDLIAAVLSAAQPRP
jgi:uncharacterized protein